MTRAKKLTTALSSFTLEFELEDENQMLHVVAGGESTVFTNADDS
jgi:hypothetical protein